MTILTSDQIVWTMIKDLLSPEYYDQNNIFNSYQNNFTLPQTDDFIIITRKNILQNGLPIWDFDVQNQKKIYTAFGDWQYQVDLFGNNADEGANIFFTFINASGGSNYLIPYNCGIGRVNYPINLTNVNDRERYMKRYMLSFTLMNISKTRVSSDGISQSDIDITYIEET